MLAPHLNVKFKIGHIVAVNCIRQIILGILGQESLQGGKCTNDLCASVFNLVSVKFIYYCLWFQIRIVAEQSTSEI